MKFRIKHTALLPLLLITVILVDQMRCEDEETVQVKVRKVKKRTKKVGKLKSLKPKERPQADAPPSYSEYDNYDNYDYGDGERDYDAETGKWN